MNRRTFKLATLGFIGAQALPDLHVQSQQAISSPDLSHPSQWPGQVYRRSLVDIDIPDWDPNLLSKFDTGIMSARSQMPEVEYQ